MNNAGSFPKYPICLALLLAAIASNVFAYPPQTKIQNPKSGTNTGLMGSSIAIDGNTMIVGAQATYVSELKNAGMARVYVTDGTGGWKLQAELFASDASPEDQFGSAVAIFGDTAVVGAWMDDAPTTNSGSAYVFTRSGTTWTQQAKLTASDAAQNHHFGVAASISGDTVIIAHLPPMQPIFSSGSAYIFTRMNSNWTQQARLKSSERRPF